MNERSVDAVVLLHGLGRGPNSMKRLHEYLVRQDFWAVKWTYPTHEPVETHGEQIHDHLLAMDEDPAIGRVHVVGHSLGAIVARYALSLGIPKKMGRVVMLAPPNQGSPLADVFKPVIGQTIRSLDAMTEDEKGLVHQIQIPESVEVGIIAAERDGKVPLESTHLPEETDHIVVPGFHTWIMNRTDVHEYVAQFLKSGRFAPSADDRQAPPRHT